MTALRGTDRQRLRAVSAVLRRRGERIDAGEAAYRVYLAVMLTIIVVAPVVRSALIALTSGSSADPVSDSASSFSVWLAPVLTGATGLLVLAGSRIGPARAGLHRLDLLFTTPVSRVRLLRGALLRWFGSGAVAGAAVAGVLVVARGMNGALEPGAAFALPLTGAGLGILAVSAPLVGQTSRRVRTVAASVLALLAVAQWLLARAGGPMLLDPWSCAASVLVDGAAPPWFVLVPVAAAVVAAACAPVIASRMRWEALREQALRWDTVQTLVAAGDPSVGLARLGAPVRWGRRLRLRPPRGLTGAIVARDLLGVLRTPGRALLGLAGVLAAGALWGAATGIARPSGSGDAGGAAGGLLPYVGAALLGAAALLIGYLASSAWCRGLAAAAQGSGSPPLLPAGPVALMARHLIVPAALTAVLLGVGALGWTLLGPAAANGWGGVGGGAGDGARLGDDTVRPGLSVAWLPVSAVCAAAATISMRTVTALKGPIPMRLLAPVPTPAGDMAGANVLLWILDGPIDAMLIGAVLGILWGPAAGAVPVAALIVSALLLAILAVWARVRLER